MTEMLTHITSQALYLLSSLLRGNALAQDTLFNNPSNVLAFTTTLSQNTNNPKLLAKMLTLINDLVEEMIAGDGGAMIGSIKKVVEDRAYCDSALKLVTSKIGGYQEVALETMASDRCWVGGVRGVVERQKIRLTMEKVREGWEEDMDMDGEWRGELVGKVEAIVEKTVEAGEL